MAEDKPGVGTDSTSQSATRIGPTTSTISSDEGRTPLSAKEQRLSIALGFSSLKIPLTGTRQTKSVDDNFNAMKKSISSVTLMEMVQKKADNLFQASYSSKICRKVFRSNDAITEEQNRQFQINRFIIHPFSLFRWYWDFIMVLALMTTLITLPVQISFYIDEIQHWRVANIFFDIIFLIDIVLNFRTGFVFTSTEEVILDNKKIIRHYLKTWFVVDFLSSIPFDYIVMLVSGSSGTESGTLTALFTLKILRLTKFLSLLRIFRMARLVRYLQKLEEILKIDAKMITILNLVLLMLVFCHWNACLQYLVIFIEDYPSDSWVVLNHLNTPDTPVWSKYSRALFRAMSQMLCIGYGRAPPINQTELWMTIISMCLGATFYALFIGAMSTLLMTMDYSGRQFTAKLSEVKEYMRFRRLPLALQKRIFDYYDHKYQRKYFDEQSILSDAFMSQPIREEVLMHKCRNLLEKVPFLASGTNDFIVSVINKLRYQVYFPGETIIRAGLKGNCMYFIEHGKVEIVLPDGTVANRLGDGCHFGEIALLMDERRVASVVTAEVCDVFELTRSDFDEVLRDFPEMRVCMEAVAEERLEQIGVRFPSMMDNEEMIQVSHISPQELNNERINQGLYTSPKENELQGAMLEEQIDKKQEDESMSALPGSQKSPKAIGVPLITTSSPSSTSSRRTSIKFSDMPEVHTS